MSTTTIKPLTIQDEVRGNKTVARILLNDPRTGKRVNRRWPTRSEAETFVAAVEAYGLEQALTFDDSRRGTAAPSQLKAGSSTRFGIYATEYLGRRRTTKKGTPIAEGTLRAYRVRLALVERTPLALTPIRDITPDHLEAFIKAIAVLTGANGKTLSEGYRRSALVFVATVLGEAFKRGDIPGDPSQHIDPLVVTDAVAPVILTPAQFSAIAAQAGEIERLFFSFLLQSGCRYGEAVELEWSSLKLDEVNPEINPGADH
jgi:integrase